MNNVMRSSMLRKGAGYILFLICFLVFSDNSIGQNCPRNINRSIEGACNNIRTSNTQNFGAAQSSFYREMPAQYSTEDFFNGIDFPNRPNPRAISNTLFNQSQDNGNSDNLSSFIFTWGQFLDHDITLAEEAHIESASIPLPANEPLFTSDIAFNRSAIYPGTGISSPRNQRNLITAWIDGSQVYGSDITRANWLRTFSEGKLKMSTGDLLPYNTLNGEKNGTIDPNAPTMAGINNGQTVHFVSGDVRASEQPGLTALHILFSREHNRICDELINQGLQNDEEIYQQARKQVGAIMQAITYEQFLPALGIQLAEYSGYDDDLSPDIMNIFATAAYRIGHTMVTSKLLLLNDDCMPINDPINLAQGFFNSQWIETFDIDPILKGLAKQQQEAIDIKVVDGLRNFLFALPQLPGIFGLDLASLNIQRGRDHGLPDYKSVRQYFLNQSLTSFQQISNDPIITQQLAALYNNDVDNIDLWVGLLAEGHSSNSQMGPTMEAILTEQFSRIRNSDYYYYKNDPAFSDIEKQAIQNTQLRDLILRNTDLNNLQENLFYADPCTPLFSCEDITISKENNQIKISGLTAPFTAIKIFDKKAGWAVVADCNGAACGSTPIFDLPASDYFVEVSAYAAYWRELICQKKETINLEESTSFNCESILVSTNDNEISISGLTATFSTIKIFDKNTGWAVVESCIDCEENPRFNIPDGDYYIQISAYQKAWQDLICIRELEVTLNGNNEISCESITVSSSNEGIAVNNLTAPFCTVKIFDRDLGWQVIDQCIGTDCMQNQLFTMEEGNYTVEVVMYEDVWKEEICRQIFTLNESETTTSRSNPIASELVYPNPAQDMVFIDLEEYGVKSTTLQLTNQYGQLIKQTEISVLSDNLLKMDIGDLPNGWYYLTIKVNNHLPVTKKLVVSRLY